MANVDEALLGEHMAQRYRSALTHRRVARWVSEVGKVVGQWLLRGWMREPIQPDLTVP